jgi:hypothetical protein
MRPPFVPNPPIKTYQSNAFALGAFLALGEGASGILDNNFIMLGCVSNLKNAPRPILFLPFLSPETFSACGLGSLLSFKANSRMELSKAITSSLQRGFLVRLGVDEYHIPDRWPYGNKHRIHDVLVTSAASDAASFELIGYCVDRRYRPSACSLDDLSNGYFAAVEKTGKRGFLAFKAELHRPVAVDLAVIKRQLECLLQSRDPAPTVGQSAQKSGEPILHGLAVFDACEQYVRSLTPNEWLDRRVFSLVAEHSEMMLRRMLRVENLLGVKIDKTPAERATHIAGRLKLLSLLPEQRRSEALFAAMAKFFWELKPESRNTAEILWRVIDENR